MAFLFDEDFESYSIGATLPLGVFTGGGGAVAANGDVSNKCYEGLFSMSTFTSLNNAFSLCFSFKNPDAVPGGSGKIVRIFNQNPGDPLQSKVLFELCIEIDNSLTPLAGGFFMQTVGGQRLNSVLQGNGFHIVPNTWYFISCILGFNADIVTHNIIVNLDLYVDGVLIMYGSGDTGVSKFITYSGSADVNLFNLISGSIRGSSIDNITADLGLSIFPHESLSADRHAKVSAAAVEYLQLPSDARARISAGAIEYLKLPSDQNVRIAAAVIELITKRSSAQTGWIVKEC